MANENRDTEIILGTGRMLAIFFSFALVCAVFFAIGFSLGRKTTMVGVSSPLHGSSSTPAAVVRPSAGTDNKPAAPPTDFSFYKSVSSKSADTSLAPKDSQAQPASGASEPAAAAPAAASAAPAPGGYYVQVAAVSRQEDADSLVEALKKKQYPAFATSNSTVDKFYHVQVGPYADLKDAEGMRSRLIADGYNPIVKK